MEKAKLYTSPDVYTVVIWPSCCLASSPLEGDIDNYNYQEFDPE